MDGIPADAATMADPSKGEGGKTRLLTLENIDGRTKAARFVRDTRCAVLADLGGEDGLSVLERIAVDAAVLQATMIRDAGARWLQGEPVDPAVIATLTNSFNRTADKVGWKRKPKDVTDFGAYVAKHAAAKGVAA